jgi:hypothetical protein
MKILEKFHLVVPEKRKKRTKDKKKKYRGRE